MHILIMAILLIGVLYGPQLWARQVLARYSAEDDRFPGTGGEFARHLLDRFSLQQVQVEAVPQADHYDPQTRTVRLSERYFNGKSLAAVVVAAHEVGHALQHAEAYRPLLLRTRLALIAHQVERLGSLAMVAMPVITLASGAPAIGRVMIGIGLMTLAAPVLVHLVTLPAEWHASFRRAMPILAAGYIDQTQLPAAKRILTACALTYVAGSLASLLNLWRWLRLLRR